MENSLCLLPCWRTGFPSRRFSVCSPVCSAVWLHHATCSGLWRFWRKSNGPMGVSLYVASCSPLAFLFLKLDDYAVCQRGSLWTPLPGRGNSHFAWALCSLPWWTCLGTLFRTLSPFHYSLFWGFYHVLCNISLSLHFPCLSVLLRMH